MRILHIAPINVAGVPYSMVQMQRAFGHDARLVTLHRNTLSFPEDICLNLPIPRNVLARWWRHFKRAGIVPPRPVSTYQQRPHPPVLRPKNAFERIYFALDDRRRVPAIDDCLAKYKLDQYEIIHYDGGADLYRDARLARKWKLEGKKIICHYMGSDLRVRGVHPVMDSLSDLNLTNESDHLLLHSHIHYVFIPFDATAFRIRSVENKRLRIVHAPSNRSTKGTHLILPVMKRLQEVRDVEFVLVERTPHDQVIRIKESCDIAIEQVGNFGGTGYGRNSLETLAMGIPTVTEMTPDYLEWIPDNPFVLATPDTLLDRLLELIDDPTLRRSKGEAGRAWVENHHSFDAVHRRLQELYRDHGIIV